MPTVVSDSELLGGKDLMSVLKLTGCFLGYRCVQCRTFNRFGTSCEKTAKGFGASHSYSVFVESPFGFRNLEIDDKDMAIFKYRRESPPDDEDSDHSVIHGLLLALGNKGKPKLHRRRRHRYHDRSSALHNEKAPIFVVQVRGVLIDSEVPLSRLDVENEGISVDWKNLFTSYFDHFLRGVKQKEMVSPRGVSICFKLKIPRMRLYQNHRMKLPLDSNA